VSTTPNLGLVLTPDGNTTWGNDQRTNLSTIDTFAATTEKTAHKGQPSGYASLDSTGNVPAAQLGHVPYIRGTVLDKAETGTDNNVLTVTPAAAVGLYRVSIFILITSQTGANLNWGVSWTASDGLPKDGMGSGIMLIGSSSVLTNFGNLGGYFATQVIDVDNSASPIVVKVSLTAGTITYKASAVIEQLI
jgi:hypothetical protein